MTLEQQSRAGDGGIYMVIADSSPEFDVALRFALRLAHKRRGHVAVIRVLEDQDFVHWAGVEEKMRHDQRLEAEQQLWEIAKTANELNGHIPGLYIEEGEMIPAVTHMLEQEPDVAMLVLANGVQGPGPLVSHFTGKGGAKLNIPVLIIPGHLENTHIDALA